MQDQNKGMNIGLILSFIFIVVGGWAIVFLIPNSVEGNWYIIPILSLFTLAYVVLFVKYLVNPRKFVEHQANVVNTLDSTPQGKGLLSLSTKAWGVDVSTFQVVRRNVSFVIPFLVAVCVIGLLAYFSISQGGVRDFILYAGNIGLSNRAAGFLLVYIYSLVGCIIYTYSYIVLGYLIRRKYLLVKESFVMTFARWFRSVHLVLVLSILWWLLFFTFTRRKRNALSQVGSYLSLGLGSAFKLFVYTNLVRISLGEATIGLSEIRKSSYENVRQVMTVWFGSGLLASSIALVFLVVALILSETGIIGSGNADQSVTGPLLIGFLILLLLCKALSNQIGLFRWYFNTTYSEDIA